MMKHFLVLSLLDLLGVEWNGMLVCGCGMETSVMELDPKLVCTRFYVDNF